MRFFFSFEARQLYEVRCGHAGLTHVSLPGLGFFFFDGKVYFINQRTDISFVSRLKMKSGSETSRFGFMWTLLNKLGISS